jgi:hypothetical protein
VLSYDPHCFVFHPDRPPAVGFKYIEGGLQSGQVLFHLLGQSRQGWIVLHDGHFFEPRGIECQYNLCMFQRVDLRLQLGGHLIHEIGFRDEIVPFSKRGPHTQVPVTDLGKHPGETIERAGDTLHEQQGMNAMDQNHDARAKRPGPESGMQTEQVVGHHGALLPGEGWVVERLQEWFENRDGQ